MAFRDYSGQLDIKLCFILQSVAIILATTAGAAASAYLFGKVNKTAGYLMVPYVLWLAYASTVNIGTAILNQEGPRED